MKTKLHTRWMHGGADKQSKQTKKPCLRYPLQLQAGKVLIDIKKIKAFLLKRKYKDILM